MSRTCRGARIRGGFLAKGRAESFDLTKLLEGDGEQLLVKMWSSKKNLRSPSCRQRLRVT